MIKIKNENLIPIKLQMRYDKKPLSRQFSIVTDLSEEKLKESFLNMFSSFPVNPLKKIRGCTVRINNGKGFTVYCCDNIDNLKDYLISCIELEKF